MAAVGSDGADYLERLRGWGVEHRARARGRRQLHRAGDHHHRPRQQPDHRLPSRARCSRRTRRAVPARADIALGIIAPDGRDAMLQHAEQLARGRHPVHLRSGPGPADVRRRRAARASSSRRAGSRSTTTRREMLCERTGRTLEALSRSHLRGIVVTLGAEGCEVWQQGVRDARAGRDGRARWSTRPAAATPSAPRCCTAWSAAGRWSAAPRSATGSARSRSPAAAGRTTAAGSRVRSRRDAGAAQVPRSQTEARP